MAVTDFDTKVAVVVRDDLEAWQRLNVTAFLMSGIAFASGDDARGKPYRDADGQSYLSLLVQPVLVYEASGAKLTTVHARAVDHDVPLAIYTAEMFATGTDEDNRAAVATAPTAELDLVGLAVRAPHRDTDKVVRGLKRHP